MSFSRFATCLIFTVSFLSFKAAASDFESGVREAKAKNWTEAEQLFRNWISANPMSANGYYNLGTSLAAQQKESEAIWALEKSLKLNPHLKQAQNNLQFCYTNLGISESWEPALPYFQEKAYQFGIDSWTYISIALGVASSILIFVFLVSTKGSTRKITLIFAVLTVLILIFTLRNALNSYHFKYNNTHAIVIRDESSAYYDATGNMKFDLTLKAGTRYEIEEISNGRIGLLMKNQMVVWMDVRAVRMI